MKTKKYLIIGGGIVGSAIAREIVLRQLGEITVLEKENRLGEHSSGRNSGVIHSGINQFPGSIKATMCLEGSKRLRQYCREHGIPLNECGTLVVAQNKDEERVLYALFGMGVTVGVPSLKIIDKDELKQREPNVVGTKALFSPTGAVVDSLAFLNSVADEVKQGGGQYVLSAKVIKIEGKRVVTTQGEYEPDHIINCAGLYADQIAHQMGVGLDYTIIPFRGEYMEVQNVDVRSMVYQAPNLKYPFLSVHLTKMTDGKLLAGPNAALSLGRESYDKQIDLQETSAMLKTSNFWRLCGSREFLGLALHNAKTSFLKSQFLREIQKLCPAVQQKNIIPYRSGIRAQMVNRKGRMLEDLVVEFKEDSTHILNAVSPGMTSSLAFAEYVVNRIVTPHLFAK